MSDHDEDDGPCTAGGIKYEAFQKHQESIRREQRRYEIARDVLAGQSTRQELGTPEGEAQFAVRWADALLAELDKPVAAKQEAVTFQVGDIVRKKNPEGALAGMTLWRVAEIRDDHFLRIEYKSSAGTVSDLAGAYELFLHHRPTP